MQENYHGRLFITGILSLMFILVILLIGGIFVMYRGGGAQISDKQATTEATTTPTTAVAPKYNGSLLLHVLNDQKEFAVGEIITIDVYANSDDQSIVGYDLELNIIGGAQFDTAVSAITDFDMHPTLREEGVYLTSLKSLTSLEPAVFIDAPIATLTFIATAPGAVTFKPVFIAGETSHSNLMNENSESVLSSVEGVTITIL